MRRGTPGRLLLAAVTLTLFAGVASLDARAQAPATTLASHRAVYDLTLSRTRGKRMQSVRGRILYDFAGNACEGYALQFRQVSELDSGEGKVAVSDLRATTWEDAAAKRFRFHSQNSINERDIRTVDGAAERDAGGVAVKLSKPAAKSFNLEPGVVFPTDHMRRIIEAAQQGLTLLELPVFDGSDDGEKVYNTLSVIGREIAPGARLPTDAAAGKDRLAGLKRWPVTVSYFDRSASGGEQMPVYSIGFELYQNGISRALTLDYGDFVVAGVMSQLELKEERGCP
jgi:hypothetical protein